MDAELKAAWDVFRTAKCFGNGLQIIFDNAVYTRPREEIEEEYTLYEKPAAKEPLAGSPLLD